MFKSSSFKKGLAASLILNLVSKGLLFVVNLMIAASFGADDSTDIYFFCYSLIILVVSFSSGITTSVLVPEYFHIESKHGESSRVGFGFINKVFYYGLMAVFIISIPILISPVFFFTLISKFSRTELVASSSLIQLMIPVLILQCISTFLSDILVSRKYFVMPMIVSLANAVIIIILIKTLGPQFGIKSIFIANIVAFALSTAIQLWLLKTSLRWNFLNTSEFGTAVNKNILMVSLGWATTSVMAFVPMYFLSGYSNGIVTSANLAQRISDVPTALFLTHFANIIGLKFNELSANNEPESLNDLFLKAVKFILITMIPASLLVSVFSYTVSKIALGHGAMDEKSIEEVSEFVSLFMLAIPFYGVNLLVSKVFVSNKRVDIAFQYQIVSNVFFIGLIVLSIQFLGPIGYGYAYLVFYVLNNIAVTLLFKWKLRYIKYDKIFTFEIPLLLIYGTVTAFLVYVTEFPVWPSIFLYSFTYLILIALSIWFWFRNIATEFMPFIIK